MSLDGFSLKPLIDELNEKSLVVALTAFVSQISKMYIFIYVNQDKLIFYIYP